jgi:hypothetical protein
MDIPQGVITPPERLEFWSIAVQNVSLLLHPCRKAVNIDELLQHLDRFVFQRLQSHGGGMGGQKSKEKQRSREESLRREAATVRT